MLQDFYHMTVRGVSVVVRNAPLVLIACLILVGLTDVVHAQTLPPSVTTKEALILKGSNAATGFSTVISGWAKPVGSIVFIGLFVLMIFRGKQILASFGWAVVGLIGAAMAGSLVAVIWGIVTGA